MSIVNLELIVIFTTVTVSILGIIFVARFNWKRYGLLYAVSGVIFSILCYLFVILNFYSFPFRLFPLFTRMPVEVNLTVIPFLVLFGVRYSPVSWAYKIAFYWVVVHVVMLVETILLINTSLIQYNFAWDFWDSYAWWWIYLLLLERIGALIIPAQFRRPVAEDSFRFGRWAFFILHFILIITIFLGGVYLGKVGSGW